MLQIIYKNKWIIFFLYLVFVIYIMVNFDLEIKKRFWFILVVFKHMVLISFGIGAHNNSCKWSLKPCVRKPLI